MRESLAALVLLAGTAVAQEGLVVAVDDSANYDVMVFQGGAWNSLFTPSADPWGLAADNSSQSIYYNDGSMLFRWDANNGEVQLPTIALADGTAVNMVSLDWDAANGRLLGTRNIGGDGAPNAEALYAIDAVTGEATQLWDYPSGDFDFGGLGYDAATDRLFGTNDDSSPQRGLYELFANSAALIAPYPNGETDIDGLAAFNNIAYLVTDEPGDFYMLDVTNPGAGYTPFPGPWNSNEIFAGAAFAAWIPAPSGVALFGLASLGLCRRRR